MTHVSDLIGMTLEDVNFNIDRTVINFHTDDGRHFQMLHYQDCREVPAILSGEDFESILVVLKQCKSKHNLYHEFSDWKITRVYPTHD